MRESHENKIKRNEIQSLRDKIPADTALFKKNVTQAGGAVCKMIFCNPLPIPAGIAGPKVCIHKPILVNPSPSPLRFVWTPGDFSWMIDQPIYAWSLFMLGHFLFLTTTKNNFMIFSLTIIPAEQAKEETLSTSTLI